MITECRVIERLSTLPRATQFKRPLIDALNVLRHTTSICHVISEKHPSSGVEEAPVHCSHMSTQYKSYHSTEITLYGYSRVSRSKLSRPPFPTVERSTRLSTNFKILLEFKTCELICALFYGTFSLTPSGNYMNHLLWQSVMLHFVFIAFVWL
jgi:hypothetical protein